MDLHLQLAGVDLRQACTIALDVAAVVGEHQQDEVAIALANATAGTEIEFQFSHRHEVVALRDFLSLVLSQLPDDDDD